MVKVIFKSDLFGIIGSHSKEYKHNILIKNSIVHLLGTYLMGLRNSQTALEH